MQLAAFRVEVDEAILHMLERRVQAALEHQEEVWKEGSWLVGLPIGVVFWGGGISGVCWAQRGEGTGVQLAAFMVANLEVDEAFLFLHLLEREAFQCLLLLPQLLLFC